MGGLGILQEERGEERREDKNRKKELFGWKIWGSGIKAGEGKGGNIQVGKKK